MNSTPEKLLKYAVEQITTHINQHMSPAEAVEKVAKELDLNANFIKRACEVVNVALHYDHFKKHAADKDSDFPIVDAAKITANIFGETEKTAHEFKTEEFSSVSGHEILPNFNKYANDQKFKEAYLDILKNSDTSTNFPTTFNSTFEKAASYIQSLEKELDAAKTKLAGATYNMECCFADIVNHFSKDASHRTSFAEFEKQAYSLYGQTVSPYIDFMAKEGHITEKRGSYDPGYKVFDDSPVVLLFGKFLKHANEYYTGIEEVKVAEYNYQFEKDYKERTFKKEAATETFAEKVSNDATDPIMDIVNNKLAKEMSVRKAALEEVTKEAFDFKGPLGMLSDKYKEESTAKSQMASTSDQDNLDRKLLLEELGTTDPVLSRVEPHKLVQSYQQLLHLAPDVAKEKELVRAQLRQMASAQSLSPYDGTQLIDTNSKLLKQKMLFEGKPSPGGN